MSPEPPETRSPWPGRMLRLLLVLLVFGAAAGGAGLAWKWDDFGRYWNAPLLDTPVVVIETDDWGVEYEPPQFVPPSAAVDAGQAAGVRRVTAVLQNHRDAAGRQPIASAFVVMFQADTPAIAADPEFQYHSTSIKKCMPETVAALREAQKLGLFELVYHGRDHRDAGLWAQNVRKAVEQARAAGQAFDSEVVRTFHPRDDARGQDMCIAEYFDSREGYLKPLDEDIIDRKVREGLAEFERIFGRSTTSTVPPRYLWGPAAEAAFARHGIRTVHGVNKQGGAYRGREGVWSRPFGVRLSHDLVGVPRNVDVEISRDGVPPAVDDVLASAAAAIDAGQPAVICTHHCNYVGSDELGSRMAVCLSNVLDRIETRYPDLRYLTSEEAGTLARTGAVQPESRGETYPAVRAASGLTHTWLFLRGLYVLRPKVRFYARGLAVLAGLTVLAGVLAWVHRRGRREEGTAS